jgi:hypothetical protein
VSPLLQSNLPGVALGTYSAADPASANPIIGDNAGFWGPWLAGVRYGTASQVLNVFDGGQYIALKPSLGVRPDTDPTSWLPVGSTLTKPEIEALIAAQTGAWTPLELGAGVEANTTTPAGLNTPRCRTEDAGTVVRLRGGLKAAALKIGERLFTLPVGFRPPAVIFLPAATINAGGNHMTITAAGVASMDNENGQVYLDGLTFSLT